MMLLDREMTYQKISNELRKEGIEISKSSIGRYAKYFYKSMAEQHNTMNQMIKD